MNQTTRIFHMIVGILILLSSLGISCQASSINLGPYPQHQQYNSLIISWETTTPTVGNEVHWGSSPLLGNITVEHTLFPRTFHQVTLMGLTASTQYYYTVVSNGTESSLYHCWTRFQPNDTVHFVVYGDTRGGWDNWYNTLLVSQAIEERHPSFVINTGDLVDEGRNSNDWIEYFAASPFVHNSSLYPVLGNHENYSRLYFTYFSLPSFKRWYSFDNGPVHCIVLDSNPRNAYKLFQRLWLIFELRINQQPYTIVIFHHPPYSSGEEHGNNTLLQKLWAPLFTRYHVDIVFNGHDHDYERSIVNNVTYIVTGGGGAPLYNVGHSPWTIYSEKTYHYCYLTVSPLNLTFEARKPDGTVFDSFSLSH